LECIPNFGTTFDEIDLSGTSDTAYGSEPLLLGKPLNSMHILYRNPPFPACCRLRVARSSESEGRGHNVAELAKSFTQPGNSPKACAASATRFPKSTPFEYGEKGRKCFVTKRYDMPNHFHHAKLMPVRQRTRHTSSAQKDGALGPWLDRFAPTAVVQFLQHPG